MTDIEEMNSISPTAGGSSDHYEFNDSSLGSASSSIATVGVAIALHRHNSQLLREKQDMESKHSDELGALHRQNVLLQDQISRLTAEVQTLLEDKSKLEATVASYRERCENQNQLQQEVECFEERISALEKDQKRKDELLQDQKRVSIGLRTELSEKIEEILTLQRCLGEKDAEIQKLKTSLTTREVQILELQQEYEAENVRMEAVRDVQVMYEELRKKCQERDRQVKQLEEVLDQLNHEKEKLSAVTIQLREENQEKVEQLDELTKMYHELKLESERRYEDACQQYISKLHSVYEALYGTSNYPGKTDNAPLEEENASLNSYADANLRTNLADVCGEWYPETKNRSRMDSSYVSVMADSAKRTIQALRSEYDIERSRNSALQEENTRLAAECDRLRVELYGEIQNESLSSWNCVLLARGIGGDGSSNEMETLAGELTRVKSELERCIGERDVAKTELLGVRSDLERISSTNRELRTLVKRLEAENGSLDKEKKTTWYSFVVAENRIKALQYQKGYLKRELDNACRSFPTLSHLHSLKRPISDHSISYSRSSAARRKFRSAGWAVIAIFKMVKRAERSRTRQIMFSQ